MLQRPLVFIMYSVSYQIMWTDLYFVLFQLPFTGCLWEKTEIYIGMSVAVMDKIVVRFQ